MEKNTYWLFGKTCTNIFDICFFSFDRSKYLMVFYNWINSSFFNFHHTIYIVLFWGFFLFFFTKSVINSLYWMKIPYFVSIIYIYIYSLCSTFLHLLHRVIIQSWRGKTCFPRVKQNNISEKK